MAGYSRPFPRPRAKADSTSATVTPPEPRTPKRAGTRPNRKHSFLTTRAPEGDPMRMLGTQPIPLRSLVAWDGNPRRTTDQKKIEELAGSLEANGQLQNLIVRPVKRPDLPHVTHEIVAGGRRYDAAMLLVDRTVWTIDHRMVCDVRELTDGEALKIAIAENFNRQAMGVMEEAEAFAALLGKDHTLACSASSAFSTRSSAESLSRNP
jgi:ParB family chromosome partitioning protein